MKALERTRTVFEVHGIKVVYFGEFYYLGLPNVRVLEPEQTDSGGWEAWTAFNRGQEEKLVELHTDDMEMTPELFFHVLAGIEAGFSAGLSCGRLEVQNAASYAVKALAGELDMAPLIETSSDFLFNPRKGADK